MKIPFVPIKIVHTAQIVATIEFVPTTLFFSPTGSTWLHGDLTMGGIKIGESKYYDFTKEEKDILLKITLAAVRRHHDQLKKHGNN